jgi:hypothetical protein
LENRVLREIFGEQGAEGDIWRTGCRGRYLENRVLREIFGEQGAEGDIWRTGC